jgi:hypothetical protein
MNLYRELQKRLPCRLVDEERVETGIRNGMAYLVASEFDASRGCAPESVFTPAISPLHSRFCINVSTPRFLSVLPGLPDRCVQMCVETPQKVPAIGSQIQSAGAGRIRLGAHQSLPNDVIVAGKIEVILLRKIHPRGDL